MAVTEQTITHKVADYLKQRFFAKEVTFMSSQKFADLGVDSMAVVELVMFIEEEFGIVIPADQLTATNLESLESLVQCAIQNQTD